MASGYSPAQLFLGRKINTDVPTHPSVLAPKWPEFNEVRNKSALNKARQKQWFDKRHRARNLPILNVGDHVYVRDGKKKIPGKVIKKLAEPRSYLVETKSGFVRRNRWMLIKPVSQPVFNDIDIGNDEGFENSGCENTNINRHDNIHNNSNGSVITQPELDIRRSSRQNIGVPPPRLGLYT